MLAVAFRVGVSVSVRIIVSVRGRQNLRSAVYGVAGVSCGHVRACVRACVCACVRACARAST